MFKIALDAGHNKTDDAKHCVGYIDPNKTLEWFLNDRISKKIAAILETEFQKGVDYDLIHVEDPGGVHPRADLWRRPKKANDWGADFYLSIHHNAGVDGGSGGGPTVHTYTYASGERKTKDEKYRKIIYNEFISTVGFFGNRSDTEHLNNFQVLREAKMPAVLIECGFMDSRIDTPMIITEDFANKAARGLANALIKIGGLVSTKSDGGVWIPPQNQPSNNNNNSSFGYEIIQGTIGSSNQNTNTEETPPSPPENEAAENENEKHSFTATYGEVHVSKPITPYKDLKYSPQQKEIEELYKVGVIQNESENFFKKVTKNASGTITNTTTTTRITRGEMALWMFNTVCYLENLSISDKDLEDLKTKNGGYYYGSNVPGDEMDKVKAVEFLCSWGIFTYKDSIHISASEYKGLSKKEAAQKEMIETVKALRGSEYRDFLYGSYLEKNTMRKWMKNLYIYLTGE